MFGQHLRCLLLRAMLLALGFLLLRGHVNCSCGLAVQVKGSWLCALIGWCWSLLQEVLQPEAKASDLDPQEDWPKPILCWTSAQPLACTAFADNASKKRPLGLGVEQPVKSTMPIAHVVRVGHDVFWAEESPFWVAGLANQADCVLKCSLWPSLCGHPG